MTLFPLFLRGGPVMVVLLTLSLAALTIVLLKSWQFLRLRRLRSDALEQWLELVEAGRGEEAASILGDEMHPVVSVYRRTLGLAGDPAVSAPAAAAEVSRLGSALLRRAEAGLRPLSIIAQLSPLLGLLGTVLGMIQAFMRIEEAGSVVDPAVLSGGIWQALLTTAFGLTIAIPAMAAFHFFEGVVDRMAATMKDGSQRILLAYDKSPSAGVAIESEEFEAVAGGL